MPPDDLLCNQDADCEIVETNVSVCSNVFMPEEPYAISRKAAMQYAARLKVEGCGEFMLQMRVTGGCRTDARDWTAVCSWNACKRRSVGFFSPKVRCDND